MFTNIKIKHNLLRKIIISSALTIATLMIPTLANAAFGPSTSPHDGIDHTVYPNGYKSINEPIVTFNSYKNIKTSHAKMNNGKDFLMDERQFLWAVRRTDNFQGSVSNTLPNVDFSDLGNLDVTNYNDGDILTMWVSIHNNAHPGRNDGNNTSKKAIAKNVRVGAELGGKGQSVKPKAWISSTNAVPQNVWADVNIFTKNTDEEIELEFIPGKSVLTYPPQLKQESDFFTEVDNQKFFTKNGIPVRSNSNFKWGNYWGCAQNSGYIIFHVKLKKTKTPPPPTTPICKSLDLTPKIYSIYNEKTEFTAKVNLSKGSYEGKEITWSTDPTSRGTFSTSPNSKGTNPLKLKYKENQKIYYFPDQKSPAAKVQVTTNDIDCKEPAIAKPKESLICENINFINSPKKLKAGETYTVEFNPKDSYSGKVRWQIKGKGLLSDPSKSNSPLGGNLANALNSGLANPEINPLNGTTLQVLADNPTIETTVVNNRASVRIDGIGTNATLTVRPISSPVAPACNKELSIKDTTKQCEEIKLNKTKLEKGTICATVTKGDYSGEIEWTIPAGKAGRINGQTGPVTTKIDNKAKTDTSSINQSCVEISGVENQTSSLSMKAIGTNAGSCQQPVKINTGPKKKVCERLATTPNTLKNGKMCVTVAAGTYKGPIKWEIPAGKAGRINGQTGPVTTQIDSNQNNESCVKISGVNNNESEIRISATGTDAGQCSNALIVPTKRSNECAYLRWESGKRPERSDRTQEICVNAYDRNGRDITNNIKDFRWFIDRDRGRNQNITQGSCIRTKLETADRLRVEDFERSPGCYLDYDDEETPKFVKDPEIRKWVKKRRDNRFSTRTTVSFNERTGREQVEYAISYIFETEKPVNVIITDEIGKHGYLRGSKDGKIENARIKKVENHNRDRIDECRDDKDRNCWSGNIDDRDGVIIKDVKETVTIYYTADVKSEISDKLCNSTEIKNDCAERFFNQANGWVVAIKDRNVTRYSGKRYGEEESNDTQVLVPCRFFLTRAGGDVFFEKEIEIGADSQFCGRRNTTGIIIKNNPDDPFKVPETGSGKDFSLSHEVCKLSSIQKGSPLYKKWKTKIDDLPPGYTNPIKNFSSLICEIQLSTASNFNKEFISASIDENIKRISRWNTNLNTTPTLTSDFFTQNKTTQVFRKTNGDLKISDLKIPANMGARTIIIENGDLIINKNITYPKLTSIANPRTVPSLAFIVLGGNIQISKDVSQIDGVLFVQKKPGKDSGFLKQVESQDSDKQLLINGSVFGDIQPLFKKRQFSGDPLKDEGSIVIRYDQRIILNTPPGLQEVADINQTEFAN